MSATELIRDLINQANNDRQTDAGESAREKLTEALAHSSSLGDAELIEWCLNDLARIERDLGNLENSEAHYQELKQRCSESARPRALAHSIRHLADIKQEMHQVEVAREYYQQAIDLYREDTDWADDRVDLDLANALRGYGVLESTSGNRPTARELLAEAREIYALLDITSGVGECDQLMQNLTGEPSDS